MAAERTATHQATSTQQPKDLRKVLGRHCLDAALQSLRVIAIGRVCATQAPATLVHTYSRDRDFSQLPQLRTHIITDQLQTKIMSLRVPPYPAESAAAGAVVAVTGCTGYVAGSIVQRLLELGATVHGTCRDPKKALALQVRSRSVGGTQVTLGSVFSSERAANDAVRGAHLLPVVLSGQA